MWPNIDEKGPFVSTFLDGAGVTKAVRDLCSKGVPVRAAVAYWGAGAVNQLGIVTDQELTVVCDLMSGGCNPGEVRKLMKLIGREKVRKQNGLHAKVWFSADTAILGSSNASSNGLCYEGKKTAGLVEANLHSRDPKLIANIEAWWHEAVWGKASEISESDLTEASARREALRNRRPMPVSGNLLEVIKTQIEIVSDRKIYVWVWSEDASKQAKEAIKHIRTDRGDDSIDFYDTTLHRGASLPKPGSTVIDFKYLARGSYVFQGFYQILTEQPSATSTDNVKLLLCKKVNHVYGLGLGKEDVWVKAIKVALGGRGYSGWHWWPIEKFSSFLE